ncbi:hypothetical protein [Streptomyces sp. NBC_00490]|uniref:hypothetical protein n=1 Tax=Streptomyces sp. NBC_00490 TaxID=2903657 RepID=UPI003FCEBAF4
MPGRGRTGLTGPDGGRRWRLAWTAAPGEHLLSVRATDAEGRTLPLEQPWNRGGFAGNLVQRVPVLCLDEHAPGSGGGPPDRR